MKYKHAIIIILIDILLVVGNTALVTLNTKDIFHLGIINLPFYLIFVLFIFVLNKKYHVDFNSQFSLPRHVEILIIPIIAYALVFIMKPLVYLHQYLTFIRSGPEGLHIPGIHFSPWENIQYIIMVIVVAPILEEMFLRGVIMNQLLKKHSPIGVITLTSVLFGLTHGPPSMFAVMILSVFSSLLYLYSRSVLISIIFHSAWNFSGYIQAHQENLLNNGFYFSKIYLFLIIPLVITLVIGFIWKFKRIFTTDTKEVTCKH